MAFGRYQAEAAAWIPVSTARKAVTTARSRLPGTSGTPERVCPVPQNTRTVRSVTAATFHTIYRLTGAPFRTRKRLTAPCTASTRIQAAAGKYTWHPAGGNTGRRERSRRHRATSDSTAPRQRR